MPSDVKLKITADAKQAIKEVDKLDKSLEGVKKEVRGTGKVRGGLDSIAGGLSKMALAAGAVGGAIYTLKKGWDFAKEGAELEFTTGKFDRLAESAGTTADVLLDDLRLATRGTRSDMELMASATDFMALGLAKSHDEVVRLTRVAGALGMNMNQLVLTLTNRTTMRFDALGVAVDGFDEKVKALEDSGLSVQDAFTEAFLQQAEEQITKVGDIADTNAGKVMAMEAAIANLSDTAKLRAAPAIGQLADNLVDLINNIDRWAGIQVDANQAAIDGTDSYEEYMRVLLRGKDPVEQLIAQFFGLTEEQYNMIRAMQLGESAVDNFAGKTSEAQRAVGPYTEGISAADEAQDKAQLSALNYANAVDRVGRQADESQAEIGRLLDILDSDPKSPIAAFREDMEWWIAGGQQINEAFEMLKEGVRTGKISPEDAAEWAGELYEATNDVQVDLDKITAQEAAANISETLGVSLEEAKERVTGTDSVQAALDEVTATQYKIDEALGSSVDDVRDRVGLLGNDISSLTSKTHVLNFKIKVSGGGNLPQNLGGKLPPEYQTGGSFVVPPGFSAQPYMIGVHSGEHVTVTPTKNRTSGSEGGGGTQFVEIIQNFYDRGAAAIGQAEVRRIWKGRLNESMGV